MKIGPLTITFASPPTAQREARPSKPALGEIGASGTSYFYGQLTEEEYNADLRGSKGIKIYEKMRKSDGQVRAALLACKLPLRSAAWSIEPADDDESSQDIADFVADNLFNSMTITWDNFLSQTLLMLDFGWMAFEKVFEISNGQVRWRKLAPRLPKSLYEWDLDESGGLKGLQQQVWKDNTYQFLTIPVEKLIVFTLEKEGANFEGVSLLRAAYKHWFYKDNLYRIDAMAAERHALGVPFFRHPAGAQQADKERIDELGQRLYAQEQLYVRMADGYDFDIKGLSGSIKDILPSIQEHNRQIAVSILADFLALGGGDRGSYALSKDQSSFFLMALKSVAQNISDTFNRYAIPQLVNYNWHVDSYPRLVCGNLETRDIAAYAQAINSLVLAGAIVPDRGVEETLRDILKLPPRPEPEATTERLFTGAELQAKRELTALEAYVAFAEIAKRLDADEEKLVKAVAVVQKRQIDKLVDVAGKIITGKKLERLDDIDVPFRAEVAKEIEDVLLELYKFGRQQVKKEMAAQRRQELAEGD